MTRGELRIVGSDGARTHDNCIAECAHTMQVHDVVAAGHRLRVAGSSRDKSIEALAEMTNGQWTCRRAAADRQV
jgi:hypothetical protein